MKKSLWIIIPVFKVGGVERWVQFVCSVLEPEYHVTVFVFGEVDSKALSIFKVQNVKKVNILSLFIEACKSQPHCVISALTSANLIACIIFGPLRSKVITSVHVTLTRISAKSRIHQLKRWIAHYFICVASDKVIAVSDGVKKDLESIIGNKPDKVTVIYNPCFSTSEINLTKRARRKDGTLKFVAVGRFDRQKNFKDLLVSFMQALSNGCDYTLDIFGNGPEFEELLSLIPGKFSHRIRFLGNKAEILKRLEEYDIFVLSSRFEGFGNVLAEALAKGLFCISRDCPHGPSEILMKGEYGMLISPFDNLGKLLSHIDQDFNLHISELDDIKRAALTKHLKNFSTEEFAIRMYTLLCKIEKLN